MRSYCRGGVEEPHFIAMVLKGNPELGYALLLSPSFYLLGLVI